jgi:cell volume regulation protein A
MDTASFLALLGGLLVLSYLAEAFFSITRIPPAVLLIASGVVLGPVLHLFPGDQFAKAAPYFGGLALAIILFEGGLGLELDESAKSLALAGSLALLSFVFTAGTLTLFAHGLLGLPWASAFALGSVLGVPSSAIVIPIAGRLGFGSELKTTAILDSTLGDVLGILGVGIAIAAADGTPVVGLATRRIVLSFTVGAAVAVVVGLVWSRLLRRLRAQPGDRYGEVLTFGMVLLLEGLVHTLGGASAVAVVTFGIVLSNEPTILARLLRRPRSENDAVFDELTASIHRFTQQLTFLVRTFFFVFLGMVVSWKGLAPSSALVAALVVVVVVAGRRAAVVALDRLGRLRVTRDEGWALAALLPRGLVTAVLAFTVLAAGLPGAETFPLYAFVLLVATNLLMVLMLRFVRIAPALEGLPAEDVRAAG